jgi:hypothetical protein
MILSFFSYSQIQILISVIVEVSRLAPCGLSGCALCPFWSSALLFVSTSSQPPGVYCAALLLVSMTLHYKSEWVNILSGILKAWSSCQLHALPTSQGSK